MSLGLLEFVHLSSVGMHSPETFSPVTAPSLPEKVAHHLATFTDSGSGECLQMVGA